jgi:hypothetical protein
MDGNAVFAERRDLIAVSIWNLGYYEAI